MVKRFASVARDINNALLRPMYVECLGLSFLKKL